MEAKTIFNSIAEVFAFLIVVVLQFVGLVMLIGVIGSIGYIIFLLVKITLNAFI